MKEFVFCLFYGETVRSGLFTFFFVKNNDFLRINSVAANDGQNIVEVALEIIIA